MAARPPSRHDHSACHVPGARRAGPARHLLAGVGAQLVDDAVFFVLPPAALLAWTSGLVAILLTAGAARVVTRGRTGAVVARTGLAVGGASAIIGLFVGGLGLVAIVLAAITVVAGVAGAVAGRRTDATV